MKSQSAEVPVDIDRAGTFASRGLDSVLSHSLALVALDLLIGLAAYAFAWLSRVNLPLPFTSMLLPQERWTAVAHPWLLLIATQVLFLFVMGLYDDLRRLRYREVVAQTFLVCVAQLAVITSFFFLTEAAFPRTVILLFDVVNFVLLALFRGWAASRSKARVRRVLVVAHRFDATNEILTDIENSPWMGLEIVGLVLGTPVEDEAGESDYPVLGNFEEIEEVVLRNQIEEIIFASAVSWRDEVLNSLSRMQEQSHISIAITPSVSDMVIGKLRHVNIHDTPLIEVKRNPNEPFERFQKRLLDLGLAVLVLLLTWPVFLLVGVLVRLSSPGPAFYLQKRVGLGGRPFWLFKFRTMAKDAEEESGAQLATEDDPRVTRIGRLLRRTRLDELPQTINVLKGEMSFVGPRPERPEFVSSFEKEVPGYNERSKVKPGITGLAQVRSLYHTRAKNKLKYDLAYIYNYSLSLDLLILLETLKVVVGRRGS